ncbi:MAG TPA: hypothetical protein VF228_17600 [Iamia sp.]
MAFRRKTKQPDPDHPEPVEIHLGPLPEFQANVVLADMAQRFRMRTVELASLRYEGVTTPQFKVLVHADDAEAVRRELVEAELL